jgi:hypothetical protein
MELGTMAAGEVRLRVLRVVGTAYGDLGRVLRAMPSLVAIALAIVVARAVPAAFLAQPTDLLGHVIDFGLEAAQDFLLTPFFLAVHRYIILDEVAGGYVLDWRDQRFVRFFVWSLAFTAASAVMVAAQDFILAGPFVIAIVLDIALFIVLAYAALRLTILFPAIAVDAGGATASNAVADTQGNVLRILLIFTLAYLPFLVLSFAVAWPFTEESQPPPAASILAAVIAAPALPLIIAVASRIFQALAERVVGRPPGDAPAPIS